MTAAIPPHAFSSTFNESFASFVGEEGAFRYLESRHGRDSEPYRRARERREDDERWRALQQGLANDLGAIYADQGIRAVGIKVSLSTGGSQAKTFTMTERIALRETDS